MASVGIGTHTLQANVAGVAGTSKLLEAKSSWSPGRIGVAVFGVLLAGGTIYTLSHLITDIHASPTITTTALVLLGLSLLIALGFEFVNGFHDTANAVATVIYTNSLEPHVAVVWSGFWNFAGVLLSSGAVAFGILSLLPVELILTVGSGAGFAMVFALLTAAIIWNLGTWYFGLPSSSSHTLIGSIIGVGIAHSLMAVRAATGGVDWSQALNVGKSLLLSPLVGFAAAGLLLLVARRLVPDARLYQPPRGGQPPPFWIRSLLILTCTGVSFAHGSNDGQKGMGLIMLILIGVVPAAYALNGTLTADQMREFVSSSRQTALVLDKYAVAGTAIENPGEEVAATITSRQITPRTTRAVRDLVSRLGDEIGRFPALADIPADRVRAFRNDMFLAAEALRLMRKNGSPQIDKSDMAILTGYQEHIDRATKFIPTWVKVAVALALGLGTMVGWKRIVVTVGEKIGKQHLTYAQGGAAELTAMTTIGAADMFGLPVSTTHVLSSGVAGTMAANRSGLQLGTVRSLALAWLLTLPASIMLSGFLFWGFRRVFGV